jgi:hypothetical protein
MMWIAFPRIICHDQTDICKLRHPHVLGVVQIHMLSDMLHAENSGKHPVPTSLQLL